MCDDAIATYTCGCTFNNTPTESLQARASWVLAEVSRNGMFVDLPYVREQVAKVSKEMEELVATLKTFGFTIKDAVEDLTQVQRVIRIFDLFGMDIASKVKDANVKNVSRNWLIVACATMYNAVRKDGTMPSDLKPTLSHLLRMMVDPPPKCAASEKFYDDFRTMLTKRLRKLDCAECIEGCGSAKMRSNTPLLVFLEKMAELFKQGKLLHSMKPFDEAFHELHEENYGWLPTAPKKLAPLAFLQKHLDEMMAQHEDLKFPYTPAAKKAIRKRMREAKRNALPGEPITVDVSDLEKFQIKAFDMWILKDAGLTDPFLEAYFKFKHHEKLLSTYITEKYVEKDGRVHPRFETLLRTGRTSCSSPNLQNMPREDGLREMYKAPEGKCLVSSDYGQQELVVLAYTLKKRYGKSVMYNLINAGLDLHGTFSLYRDGKLGGMDLHNLTNEDVRKIKEMCKPYKEEPNLKRSRQLSKCSNFGFGGGMGVETFYVNCRRQGFDVTQEECAELREAWFDLYPEMKMYINPQRDGQVALAVLEGDVEKEEENNDETVEEAESNADNGVEEEMVQLYCADTVFGQHRARSTYASANNFAFQAGASTVSKLALWYVYLDGLANNYSIVDFVHDEIIVECFEKDVDSVGRRVAELMVKAANTLMPGILITAEPAAMYRWSKKAEPAFDKNGKLIPWDSVENKELN